MNKWSKIVLIIAVSLVVIGIAGLFFADSIVKNKIEKLIEKSISETLIMTYDEISVNTWDGRVVILKPYIHNYGETTKQISTQLTMDSLVVDGFGYWDYVFNDKISFESIELNKPNLIYFHNSQIVQKNQKYSKLEKLKQDVLIYRVNIQEGDLTVRDSQTDSLLLKNENLTANVMDVHLNPKTVKRRIPFLFSDYNIHFDNLFYQLSNYENLIINASKITNKEAVFNNLNIVTKYSKSGLTKLISHERDHYDLKVNSVRLKEPDFGYKKDSMFYFSSSELLFENPELKVYRNKIVANDLSIKQLYSSTLRGLGFDLTLNKVIVQNGFINYSEKVKYDAPAGEIEFLNLNADITNLSNTYSKSEKTSIDINTMFMKTTPLKIDWYFDVNDPNDHFIFKADLGRFHANKMNMFTEPNLNIRLEGEIHKTYFTIDGYDHSSTVNLKLNYEDFKVVVMQKNEPKKNKLLSAVVNIFVRKDSEKEPGNFRNGTATVDRDKTKSIFNYLWLNASQGLMDAMTGDGKKD